MSILSSMNNRRSAAARLVRGLLGRGESRPTAFDPAAGYAQTHGQAPEQDYFAEDAGARLPEPKAGQLYEITLEPAPGSPTGRPTGPILVTGFARYPL